MKTVTLHDKTFRLLLSAADIDRAIAGMAERMNRELRDARPLFLVILNGAFMFASDLIKQITVPGTQISFVKVASYSGTRSSGEVRELIGLNEDLAGRTVIILEDIIDTGRSMAHLLDHLRGKHPDRLLIATLFHKPAAAECHIPVDYCGFPLDNDFIVGRGLDYDGLGRNLPDLYVLNPTV